MLLRNKSATKRYLAWMQNKRGRGILPVRRAQRNAGISLRVLR